MSRKVFAGLVMALALVATPAFGGPIPSVVEYDAENISGFYTGTDLGGYLVLVNGIATTNIFTATFGYGTESATVAGNKQEGYLLSIVLKAERDSTAPNGWRFVDGEIPSVVIADANGNAVITGNFAFDEVDDDKYYVCPVRKDPSGGDIWVYLATITGTLTNLTLADQFVGDSNTVVGLAASGGFFDQVGGASITIVVNMDTMRLDEFFGSRSVPQGYNGHCCDSSVNIQIVPEPATMSLLALGGLALLRRKR